MGAPVGRPRDVAARAAPCLAQPEAPEEAGRGGCGCGCWMGVAAALLGTIVGGPVVVVVVVAVVASAAAAASASAIVAVAVIVGRVVSYGFFKVCCC